MVSPQKGWIPSLVIVLGYLFPFLILIKSLLILFEQEEFAWAIVVIYLAASFFPTIEIRKRGLNISMWEFFTVT